MNSKKRQPVTVLLFASMVLIGVVGLSSCKKEPEPAPPPESAAQAVAAAAIEQTTCPIMGQAINKDVFVEYKGKKVYFCCPPCEDKFKANPEKYIAKLPQFKD